MLVLSRKKGEKIKIGDTIVIEVVRINGASVRIGITAPEDVRIVRGELEEFAEQLGAALSDGGEPVNVEVMLNGELVDPNSESPPQEQEIQLPPAVPSGLAQNVERKKRSRKER